MEEQLTVIFLHGFLCDNQSTTRFASWIQEYLTKKVTILTPDLPGHGAEPAIKLESLASLANFVHDSIVSKVSGNYVVCGFSLGGQVALKYAEIYKSDQNLLGVSVWASPIYDFINLNGPYYLMRKIAWKAVTTIPQGMLSRLQKANKLVKHLRKYDINFPAFDKKYHNELLNFIFTTKYELSNNVRKCFIFGSSDALVPLSVHDSLQKLNLPNSEIYLVHKGGHFGTWDGYHESCKILAKFIESLY